MVYRILDSTVKFSGSITFSKNLRRKFTSPYVIVEWNEQEQILRFTPTTNQNWNWKITNGCMTKPLELKNFSGCYPVIIDKAGRMIITIGQLTQKNKMYENNFIKIFPRFSQLLDNIVSITRHGIVLAKNLRKIITTPHVMIEWNEETKILRISSTKDITEYKIINGGITKPKELNVYTGRYGATIDKQGRIIVVIMKQPTQRNKTRENIFANLHPNPNNTKYYYGKLSKNTVSITNSSIQLSEDLKKAITTPRMKIEWNKVTKTLRLSPSNNKYTRKITNGKVYIPNELKKYLGRFSGTIDKNGKIIIILKQKQTKTPLSPKDKKIETNKTCEDNFIELPLKYIQDCTVSITNSLIVLGKKLRKTITTPYVMMELEDITKTITITPRTIENEWKIINGKINKPHELKSLKGRFSGIIDKQGRILILIEQSLQKEEIGDKITVQLHKMIKKLGNKGMKFGPRSPESIKKQKETWKRKEHISRTRSPESIRKMVETRKVNLKKNPNLYKKIMEMGKRSPNGFEQDFGSEFPALKYTGKRGKHKAFRIGKKYPDFRLLGTKVCIDLFCVFYHPKSEQVFERIEYFKKRGYTLFIFWQHDWKKKREQIIFQVNEIIQTHYPDAIKYRQQTLKPRRIITYQ